MTTSNSSDTATSARYSSSRSQISQSWRLFLWITLALSALTSSLRRVAASPRFIEDASLAGGHHGHQQALVAVDGSTASSTSPLTSSAKQRNANVNVDRLPDALRRYRFNAGADPASAAAAQSQQAVLSSSLPPDDAAKPQEQLADIALAVTIDGAIHAIRRDTGLWVWSLHDEDEAAQRDHIIRNPLVKSSSGSAGTPGSNVTSQSDAPESAFNAERTVQANPDSNEDEVYIIEPHSGGEIYMYDKPTGKLQKLPLSVAQLVDLSPFTFPVDALPSRSASASDGKLFLGRKETKLVGVDLTSGKLVGVFGPEAGWCEWPQTRKDGVRSSSDTGRTASAEDSIENRPWDLLYIGRTEYHLSIYSKKHGLLQTLSYTSYGPSTLSTPGLGGASGSKASADSGGANQVSSDGRYIQSMHDGSLVCFEDGQDGLAWTNHFIQPVVAVFDIVHARTSADEAATSGTGTAAFDQQDTSSSYLAINAGANCDSDATRTGRSRSQPVLRAHPEQIVHKSIAALRNMHASTYIGRIAAAVTSPSQDTSAKDEFFAMSNAHYPLISFAAPALAATEKYMTDNGLNTPSELDAPSLVDYIVGNHAIDEPADSGRTIESAPEPLGIEAVPAADRMPVTSGDVSGQAVLGPLPSISDSPTLPPSTAPTYLISTRDLALLLFALAALAVYVRRYRLTGARLLGSAPTYSEVDERLLPPDTPPLSEKVSLHSLSTSSAGSNQASTSSSHFARVALAEQPKGHAVSPSLDKALPALPPADEVNEKVGLLDASNSDDDVDEQGKATKSNKKGRRRKRGKRPGQRAEAEGKDDEKADMAVTPPSSEAKSASETASGSVPLTDAVVVSGDVSHPVVDKDADVAGRIGSLIVSESILGYGSHGTVVLKGTFQGRAVAVKRLLKDFVTVASHEVHLLQESDDHPNVIRYFCKEQHENFHYIALELCPASLFELIDSPSSFPALAAVFDPSKALKQITRGLMHLHKLKIIHRDLKPQNILITAPVQSRSSSAASSSPATLRVVISDFGLCKKLDLDESSFLQSVRGGGHTAPGSFGYRAPEVLRGEVDANDLVNTDGAAPQDGSHSSSTHSTSTIAAMPAPPGARKLTRSIDIFSLGCIFYYVLTMGEHPFGSRFEREVNILNDKICLEGLSVMTESRYEAEELLRAMCNSDPQQRPSASDILLHPFFWSSAKSLHFLCDASDRFEIMDREAGSVECLEANASSVVSRDWLRYGLDRALVDNLGKYRKYDGGSVRDLLRVLRNKKHHYQDLPENVRKSLGEPPVAFLGYFSKRFPKLLLHCHGVVKKELSHEAMFSTYFEMQDDS